VLTGFTASPILTISANNSLSCLCRPEVSTMMISNRSIASNRHPVNTGAHCHRCDETRLTFLELLHTHSCDRHRIRLGITPVERDLGLGRVPNHTQIEIVTMEAEVVSAGYCRCSRKTWRVDLLFELIESSGSEGIRTDQTCSEPFPLIMHGELRVVPHSQSKQLHRVPLSTFTNDHAERR
jgi:hypothetical protein